MASPKNASATMDPTSLAGMIPDDDGIPEVSTMGSDAPPMVRHEPVASPPSMGEQQKARRVSAAAPKAPAPVQPRKDIARMLPSSHRVYVYKKKEDGKISFLNEYSAQELQGVGTIEAFIKKYVVPDYEYGEFHIYYFDGQSKEPQPMGSVTIEPPASATAARPPRLAPVEPPKPTETLRDLLDIQRQMNEAAAAASKPVPKSPAEAMMEQMMATQMKKMLDGGDDKKGGDSNQMLLLMMMQQMSRPAQPTIPPELSHFMEKLAEKITRLEDDVRNAQASAAMIPPPAPVQEGPSPIMLIIESMKENNRVMLEAIRANQPPPRDHIKEMADMAMLLAPKNNESLTTKDIFSMLPELRNLLNPPGSTKDPFEKTIENFRLFKLMQREFNEGGGGQQEQTPQEDFWAFAKSLVQSDIGKSIAAQIMSQGAGKNVANAPDARVRAAQAQAAQVAQRRAAAAHAAQQRQLQGGAPAQPQRPPQRQADPVAAAPRPVAPPPPAPPPPQQPPQQAEEESQELHVPEGFLSVHAPAINNAANDAERIGAIITGFQLLATSDDFRPHIVKMFGLCKQNRRIEALDHLHDILEFFADNEVLAKDIPEKSCEDFNRHWSLIRQRLDFPDVPEVFPEGHPQAQAQQEKPAEEKPVEQVPEAQTA